MLVDNENETKSSTSNLIIGFVLITVAVIIFAMAVNNDLDDNNCKEWGVEVDDHGKISWAPLPGIPNNKQDAEHIAKQLEGQDIHGGRYYTAKCKEYKK